MRILLDECVPRPFGRELLGHDVRTIPEMGWAGKKNGELLVLLGAGSFDVFLTVDRNLQYQQQLSKSAIAVVVLIGTSNRLADLVPLAPAVDAALAVIRPGQVIEVRA